MSEADRQAALGVAIGAARAAGAVLLDFSTRDLGVRHKGDVDLVSQADLASERVVRAHLAEAFPGDHVLGEEGGGATGAGGRRWIVDPLDGTTNFVHRLPHFNVSIALEVDGVVEVGVVFDPSRGELFEATRGGGARLGGAPLRASPQTDLAEALVATGFPYDRKARIDVYLPFVRAFLLRAQGLRRAGAAALDLAWLAAGRLDVYWEFQLKPWDVAAGALLVTEAGGWVGGRGGRPHTLGDDLVIAAAPGLVAAVGDVFGGVDAQIGW